MENPYLRKTAIIAVVLLIFDFSFDSYFSGVIVIHPGITLGILFLWVFALALMAAVFSDTVDLRKIEKSAAIALAASMFLFSFVSITVVSPGAISNDGTFFMAESAEATLAGENPYELRFDQPPSTRFFTPTFEGEAVNKLLYPSLSFLSYIPFVISNIDVRFLGPLMLLLLVGIIYRLSPEKWGVIPLLAIGSSRYFLTDITLSNDLLWVNLLIGSILFFEKRHKLSAALFGLASAVRPTPWLIAPFILLRYYKKGELRSKGLEYVSYSIGSFTAINLPFIIWNPVEWTKAIFNLPLKSLGIGTSEMFYGQGLSILSFTGVLNLSPGFYSILSVLVILGLMAAYLIYFDSLKNAFWIFPLFIFFFNYRGLGKYYFLFFPIAVIVLIKLYYINEGENDRLEQKLPF